MSELSDAFTKDELLKYIEYIFIGHYIKTANQEEFNQKDQDIIMKVYDLILKEQNIDELVLVKKGKSFAINVDFQLKIDIVINDFIEKQFWKMIIDKLCERDLEDKLGKYFIEEMDDKDYFIKLEEERIKYEDEFEKNGIRNIKFYN